MRKVLLLVVSLTLAGCGAAPQRGPMDAQPVTNLMGGNPVTNMQGNLPVTGRDWNCKGCY